MYIIWRPEWGDYPWPCHLLDPDFHIITPISYQDLEDFWPDLADLPDGNDPFPHLPISGKED